MTLCFLYPSVNNLFLRFHRLEIALRTQPAYREALSSCTTMLFTTPRILYPSFYPGSPGCTNRPTHHSARTRSGSALDKINRCANETSGFLTLQSSGVRVLIQF